MIGNLLERRLLNLLHDEDEAPVTVMADYHQRKAQGQKHERTGLQNLKSGDTPYQFLNKNERDQCQPFNHYELKSNGQKQRNMQSARTLGGPP